MRQKKQIIRKFSEISLLRNKSNYLKPKLRNLEKKMIYILFYSEHRFNTITNPEQELSSKSLPHSLHPKQIYPVRFRLFPVNWQQLYSFLREAESKHFRDCLLYT